MAVEHAMKPTLRTLGTGAAIVVAIGLLAASTYNQPLAMLLWPGFLIMDFAFSLLGLGRIAFTDFGWLFWPALLINVVLYGLIYLLFRKVAASRRNKAAAKAKA
jgi:hypothetical protein